MDQKKVGRFISSLRKEVNMTQQQLANLLNVSDKTISKWENGAGYPDITHFPALSKIFSVSIDDLMYGDRNMEIGTMSLLESNIKYSGLEGLKNILNQGMRIYNTDEFGKNVIDYTIKHKNFQILYYLIDNNFIRIEKSYFVIDKKFNDKENSIELYHIDNFRRGQEIFNYYHRHNEIVAMLIEDENIEMLKKTSFLNLHLEKGYVSNIVSKSGRKYHNLSLDTLKYIATKSSYEMIEFLCGFNSLEVTRNYWSIAAAINEYSKDKLKEDFVSMVIKYNQEIQSISNKKIHNVQNTDLIKAEVQDWMLLSVIQNDVYVKYLVSLIKETEIKENTFKKIVSKYGIDIFKDDLTYKINYLSSKLKGTDFLAYIRSLYKKSLYNKFPIYEVIKKSKEIKDLDDDILVYCLALRRNNVVKLSESKELMLMNDRFLEIRNKNHNYSSVRVNMPEAYSFFGESNEVSFFNHVNIKENVDLLESIVLSCSDRVYQNVVNVFRTGCRQQVLLNFVNLSNIPAIRRIIETEAKYLITDISKNGLSVGYLKHKQPDFAVESNLVHESLSKNFEVLKEIIDLLSIGILDIILNDYCLDDDFQLMTLLINSGAMFITRKSIEYDDGWGNQGSEIVSERDGKRTAIMREMLKTLKNFND